MLFYATNLTKGIRGLANIFFLDLMKKKSWEEKYRPIQVDEGENAKILNIVSALGNMSDTSHKPIF